MTESQLHTKKQVLPFLRDLLFPRVGGEGRGEQVLFLGVSCLFSFLFAGAEALFGSAPFGLAFLAAAQNRIFPVYLAAVLGILVFGGGTAPIYIAAYSLILFLRFVLSTPRDGTRLLPASRAYFHEEPALRIAVAAAISFLCAVYQLLVGGVRLPSILYAVAMAVETPILTFLFLPFFECDLTLGEVAGRQRVRIHERLPRYGKHADLLFAFSALTVGATAVYALSPFSIFGFSFAYLLAGCLTIYAARRRDGILGALTGFAAVAPTAILPSPAFALFGFFLGLLSRFGSFAALGGGLSAATLVLGLIGGAPLLFEALPELVLSTVLIYPVFQAVQKRRGAETVAGETTVYYNQNSDLLHMKRLSEAFLNLSGTFESMTAYMKKPDRREIAALCRRVVTAHCSICERRDACVHREDASLSHALDRLATKLAGGSREGLLAAFTDAQMRDCRAVGTIVTDILSEYTEDTHEKEKNATSDLLSADYAMLSRVLSDAAERDLAERSEDKRMSSDLCAALESHGGFRGSVTVFGKRQKQILISGNAWEGERLSVDEIRALFEQICCSRLSEPRFDFSGGQMAIETHTEKRFDCEFVTAAVAGGGEMSGDVIRSFDNEEGYSYKLLSDGMGSGREASMTASLTGAYLSELLASGAAADTALKMLNQVIRQKGCECSATIDLLELDLIYGRAAFIKSGAAASYVRRGKDVFRIRSKTMPIGLLKSIDAERIHFELADGDTVIMLSDGVSQTPEDAPWLLSLLTDGWDPNLPTMAEAIIDAAKAHGRRDDMTVGLCRIVDRRTRAAG